MLQDVADYGWQLARIAFDGNGDLTRPPGATTTATGTTSTSATTTCSGARCRSSSGPGLHDHARDRS
jgi:hypothetical protein